MKNVLFAAAIAAFTFVATNDPLPIGSSIPSPATKMKDITGKEVSFSDVMKKNGLLVMFSCNTCPVVQKYQERTLDLAKSAQGKEIGVILLNSNEATRGDGESYDDMKDYGKGQGYKFPYVVDENSAMANAFGASRTPEVFLFDKNGKLVYHGAIDDNPNGGPAVSDPYAERALREVSAGMEVSKKQTKSVGCTIKRQ